MKLFVEQLDLAKTREHWPRETPFAPALVRDRKRDKAHWLALTKPFVPGEPPVFSQTEHDEYIRIPLFPYLLRSQGDLALAFMLQLGLSCAAHLPGPVTGMFIVTGKPVELLYDPDTDQNTGLRYWVGFAVTLEEP